MSVGGAINPIPMGTDTDVINPVLREADVINPVPTGVGNLSPLWVRYLGRLGWWCCLRWGAVSSIMSRGPLVIPGYCIVQRRPPMHRSLAERRLMQRRLPE